MGHFKVEPQVKRTLMASSRADMIYSSISCGVYKKGEGVI